jgi:hypothetical protein
MKTKEEIRKALSQIVMGEYSDGTSYYFGDETGAEMEEAIKLLMPLFKSYASQQTKKAYSKGYSKGFKEGQIAEMNYNKSEI